MNSDPFNFSVDGDLAIDGECALVNGFGPQRGPNIVGSNVTLRCQRGATFQSQFENRKNLSVEIFCRPADRGIGKPLGVVDFFLAEMENVW